VWEHKPKPLQIFFLKSSNIVEYHRKGSKLVEAGLAWISQMFEIAGLKVPGRE